MPDIARHKAAIRRSRLSRPVRLATEAGLLSRDQPTTILDFGCGLGDDLRRLCKQGHDAVGWDPHHRPYGARRPSKVVLLTYVLNVIEDPRERLQALTAAWELAETVLVASALVTVDARGGAVPYGDGVVTSIGTFQKYFDQQELENTLRQTCGVEPVALGMGVFAVARDAGLRAELLARQFQRRSALDVGQVEAAFQENRGRLEPLVAFMAARGRWPALEERSAFAEVATPFGSLGRAQRLLTTALPDSFFAEARRRARSDLLVLLALSRFKERLRMGQLHPSRQRDVRAHFGSWKVADQEARDLLFSVGSLDLVRTAARSATVGKRMPQALYLHVDAVESLSPVLRVYEGCARRFVGGAEGANLVKLGLFEPAISYLSYPDFERDPHPALARSLRVHLQSFRVKAQDFTRRDSPPILHRKELFVMDDHPMRPKFARLTAQEEKWGLYDGSTGSISTRAGWETRLSAAGAALRGHRLVRTKPRSPSSTAPGR